MNPAMRTIRLGLIINPMEMKTNEKTEYSESYFKCGLCMIKKDVLKTPLADLEFAAGEITNPTNPGKS
ncbi:MAG: hypothetical protein R6W72_03240 [Desulfurivibrionaceae bacterium]